MEKNKKLNAHMQKPKLTESHKRFPSRLSIRSSPTGNQLNGEVV